MRLASDPDGRALGKKERGSQEGKDKNKRVQSSEDDDCVFVRVNLFITDAREISIEMIPVTVALDISDGRHPKCLCLQNSRGE